MRHSPNLNVIIEILEKIRFNLERDFGEISKLQHAQESLFRFIKASYERSKSDIIRQISQYLPDVNLELVGEESYQVNRDSNLTYIINPIDSLLNFSRALPFCCSSIAVKDKNKEQIIAFAILHISTGDLFYASNGKGSFFNDTRVRVSKNKEQLNCALSNFYLSDKSEARSKIVTNCLILDIAYLAAGRIDEVIFDSKYSKYLEGSIFLAKEAGAILDEKNDFIRIHNGL
jgi:myo-inositol-1(or 4)-monophosphatase